MRSVTRFRVAIERVSTAQDNQSKIQVSLFRGSGELVSVNYPLGTCHIVNIPAAPRRVPQIVVTVEAAEREIRLSAVNKATNGVGLRVCLMLLPRVASGTTPVTRQKVNDRFEIVMVGTVHRPTAPL